MIEKTQAVVLRFAPVSNTSRVVTWLTEGGARVSTLIKGAQRPKSLFLGQCDLFYTCELLFYTRERQGLHQVRECFPLKLRPRFRSDWRACAAASYLADLVARLSPPDAPHPGLFELLEAGLDHLEAHGAVPAFLFWFELKLLERLGLAPRLHRCAACGRELEAASRRARFSSAHGGILCGTCAAGDAASVALAPDALAVLLAWQRSRSPAAAGRTRCTPHQLGAIEQALGLFMHWHLDARFASRGIALDILRHPHASAAKPVREIMGIDERRAGG
jgi:DNA repair protein RecO (recombination protein O)